MPDWNNLLDEAKEQFPNPLDDPRRTQKGRAWRKPGTLTPTTKESAAACDKHLADIRAELAHRQTTGANIQSHNADKAQRQARNLHQAQVNHAVETARRMANHPPRVDRGPMFVVIVIILTTCACLGSVLANYVR